jgi:hypothetical protein
MGNQKCPNFCFESLEDAGAEMIFEKCLTNSDVNGLGRLIVPKVLTPPPLMS